MASATILIGTSGWSYPKGPGKWRGVFYPKEVRDELDYYARHFKTVEVNSTFYRPASPQTAKGWAERTPQGFLFAVKAWQKFTHPKMFKEATGREAEIRRGDLDLFKRGIDPLMEAGKLGALLLQFPPLFISTAEAREGLRRNLDWFKEYPVAVELRHRSWGEAANLEEILVSRGAIWAFIDEPKFSSSIRQTLKPIGDLLYLRFHGRNREKWWKHETPEERYDYCYSEEELLPFAEDLKTILARPDGPEKILIFFNNHARAQAVANALMLKHQLGLPLEEGLEEIFVNAFPNLRGFLPKTTLFG